MKTELSCIPCIIRQTIDTLDISLTDESIKKNTLNSVMDYLKTADYGKSPALVGKDVYKIIAKETDIIDPYKEIKEKYNQAALDLYGELVRVVYQNSDPVLTSAKLAVAGNIIDFAPQNKVQALQKIIEDIEHTVFAIDDFNTFISEIKMAKNVLYLVDNAGEIVFDKLFIETLTRYYPERDFKITVIVRGGPIINDATINDARMIGLEKIVEVISSGDDAPATDLTKISKDTLRV